MSLLVDWTQRVRELANRLMQTFKTKMQRKNKLNNEKIEQQNIQEL